MKSSKVRLFVTGLLFLTFTGCSNYPFNPSPKIGKYYCSYTSDDGNPFGISSLGLKVKVLEIKNGWVRYESGYATNLTARIGLFNDLYKTCKVEDQ